MRKPVHATRIKKQLSRKMKSLQFLNEHTLVLTFRVPFLVMHVTTIMSLCVVISIDCIGDIIIWREIVCTVPACSKRSEIISSFLE